MPEIPNDPDSLTPTADRPPSGEGSYGVLTRIHLGKAALALGSVELPAGVASLLTDSPWPTLAATAVGLWTAGETIHNLHNWRHQPASELGGFKGWLVKPDQWKSKS